eukprot:6213200-Pleurochrysis_carterae.AAC.2
MPEAKKGAKDRLLLWQSVPPRGSRACHRMVAYCNGEISAVGIRPAAGHLDRCWSRKGCNRRKRVACEGQRAGKRRGRKKRKMV